MHGSISWQPQMAKMHHETAFPLLKWSFRLFEVYSMTYKIWFVKVKKIY